MLKAGVRLATMATGVLRQKRTILVCLISKKGEIEGVLSTRVVVDGDDASTATIRMIKRSRFASQIRLLVSNGISIAGLNVLDVPLLEKELRVKFISITRRKPDPGALVRAIKAFGVQRRTDTSAKAQMVARGKTLNRYRTHGFYMQTSLAKGELEPFADDATKLIRLAHIIARGVSTSESKNRV